MSEDRPLVERCQNGDEGALADLIQRYERPLYAAVYPMLMDPGSVEDVLQEAFVRFWRTIERFDLDRPVLPWIKRIAVNLALTRLSERKKEPRSVETAPEPSSEPEVERPMIEAEEIQRIEEAMATLEPNRRATLALRAIDGLSYSEIAETLGCSIGTVMSRLHRARLELRERLARTEAAEARAS